MPIKIYLSLALLWLFQTSWAAPVITPSSATVLIQGTQQFSSTDTVTWSLALGSQGSISAGGLYTAPSTYFSANNLSEGGCPLLPNDHIFNTRIDNLPVDTNSTARINNLPLGRAQFEVSFPMNFYSAATPTQTMSFQSTSNNNGVFPMLSWPYRGEEASNLSNNPFFQDHHILGVSTDTCKFWEMYQFYPTGLSGVCPTCNSISGVSYDSMTYLLPNTLGGNSGGGVDAAGMYLQPLALRYSELKSGSIKHAMRFTLGNGDIYSGFLWPAVAFTNECNTIGTCFPYGSRLRLKAGYNITGWSKTAQTILTAWKNYGIILADGGSTMHITAMADVTNDTTTWSAIWSEFSLGSSSVSVTDFEQVDESSLMVSSTTGKVAIPNPYVTPDNYAVIVATKNSDSTASKVYVAIEPPTVGVYNPPYQANAGAISVMAGTPQFQIPGFVNGSTDSVVTYAMTPTLGSLTSGGLYTAPASNFNQVNVTTITITPRISPAQAINFPLVVFSSDGIRMREGPKTSANSPTPPFDSAGNYGPDTNGLYWFMDPTGNFPNFYERDDQFSPQASWPNTTDIALFFSRDFGSGDKVWSAMMPNGNYVLKMGFGTSDSADITTSTNTLDSQGVLIVSSVPIVSTTYKPNVVITTVAVTNNQFYWAIRGIDEHSHSMLSNWSLVFLSALKGNTKTITGGGKFSGAGTIQ